MISPKFFVDTLASYGVDFYAGVPDSLLKNVCAYLADNVDKRHNIITANEGGAIGLAAGYHLATGKVGCVYMQNSGEGNVINPLASLTDKRSTIFLCCWLWVGVDDLVSMMSLNM